MPVLSSRALAGLEETKRYAKIDLAETGDDDIVIDRINAASALIHRVADREFKPVGTNPQTRSFDLIAPRYGVPPSNELRIGDLASAPTAVTIDGNVVTDLSTVVGLPRVRQEWEPIRRLRFGSALGTYPAYWPGYWSGSVIEVTGTWGFPEVPADIREACIVTVAIWLSRDVTTYSETFISEEGRVEMPRALPRQVYDVVSAYQLPSL